MTNLKMALIAALALTLPGLSTAQAESKYEIDPAHSKVGFEVPHLVISSVEGKFTDFKGTVELNEKDFARSKVTAEVNVSSIDTGVKKRDDHLRSKDFFEVAKHPKMKFVSKKVVGKKSNFKMTGDLTIKGKTKPVTFEGKYLGTVKDGYGNLKAAFNASAKIKRKDFGLTWDNMVEAGPVVGDEVTISLKVQAAKPIASKQASHK